MSMRHGDDQDSIRFNAIDDAEGITAQQESPRTVLVRQAMAFGRLSIADTAASISSAKLAAAVSLRSAYQ